MCEHFFLKRWMRLSVLSIIALGMDISRNQLITTPKPLHRHPVLSPYHATCQVLGDTLSILALHWQLCSRDSHRENLLASNLYARDPIPDTKNNSITLKLLKLLKLFLLKICTSANFVVPLRFETLKHLNSIFMKKILSLILALVVTTTLWAYDFQSGDLYYNITSKSEPYTVEVTFQKYESSDNYLDLTTAIIPKTVTHNDTTYSVTSIGYMAFFYCSSLTSVTIPNSIINIGQFAFVGTGIHYDESNWESGVLYINDCLIMVAESISGECIIKDATRLISDMAFGSCNTLTSVTIPSSVKNIGNFAFYYCSALTSITIPDSVTRIGQDAFLETGIYNNESNWENGVLYIDNCLIAAQKNISGTYTIKDGIRLVADCAFYGCHSLYSTTIPNSVMSVGNGAFYDCSSLTSVTIPNSVTSIRDYTFYNCDSLTSITIPNSVKYIGDRAFSDCSSLTSITIGNSVTCIGNNAFAGYSASTKKIHYTGDIAGWCNIKFRNSGSNPITWSSKFLINNEEVKDVAIPNTVDSIHDYAFTNCSSLTSITIPNSVKSIGISAFHNCSLVSASIGNSVTSIRERAFWGCHKLASVAIPNSVTNIGELAFFGCSSLESVIIPNSVTSIEEGTFGACMSLTEVIIGNSVTNVDIEAFFDCNSLSSIVVERGNTTYDSRDNCNAIIQTATNTLIIGCQNTIIPNSVTAIGDSAFHNNRGLNSITIPNSVTSIGNSAFCASSLTSVTIPNSVKTIGEGAFYNCSSLSSIVVAQDNTIYDSRDNCNAIIQTATNTLIFGCQNTIIPNSVTTIGKGAFHYCPELTSITIPSSVTSIENQAFAFCWSLDTVICFATTPPALLEDAFEECDNPTLFVPCEALEAYQAHEQWGQFANIQCIASEEVETDDVIITPSTTSVTITWPTAENAYHYVIEIKKDGEVFCTLTFNAEGQLLNIAFAPGRNGNRPAQYAEQVADGSGFRFTVTGLEEGTDYTYEVVTTDEADNTISTYSGEFTTQLNTPTDIENIEAQYPTSDIKKIMHNGQLLILRDGKTYNVMGAEIQ